MQLDPETHQMTAIVLAGDRTKADSLINHTKAGSKAMIDLDGTPMVRRVLSSLRRAARFWRRIEQERKKPLMVIGLLGWWAVIRYRMGVLSLEEALAKLSKRLGLRMRAVILPYANAAIDVDSIADLILVKGALEKAAAEDA